MKIQIARGSPPLTPIVRLLLALLIAFFIPSGKAIAQQASCFESTTSIQLEPGRISTWNFKSFMKLGSNCQAFPTVTTATESGTLTILLPVDWTQKNQNGIIGKVEIRDQQNTICNTGNIRLQPGGGGIVDVIIDDL